MVHPTDGFYRKDGKKYVSYSTVIEETNHICDPNKVYFLEKWRRETDGWEDIVQAAIKRGKILHHEIEMVLGLHQNSPPDEQDIAELLEDPAGLKKLRVPQYLEQILEHGMLNYFAEGDPCPEEESFSERFGFACTKDLRCQAAFKKNSYDYNIDPDGEKQLTVIDWKNIRDKWTDDDELVKKPKPRSQHADNFIQLGANALAFNETSDVKITQGAVVALYSWRPPRIHVLNYEELKYYAVIFLERLQIFKQLHNLTLPSK